MYFFSICQNNAKARVFVLMLLNRSFPEMSLLKYKTLSHIYLLYSQISITLKINSWSSSINLLCALYEKCVKKNFFFRSIWQYLTSYYKHIKYCQGSGPKQDMTTFFCCCSFRREYTDANQATQDYIKPMNVAKLINHWVLRLPMPNSIHNRVPRKLLK